MKETMKNAIESLLELIFGSNFLTDLSEHVMMIPTEFSTTWQTVESIYNSLFVPLAWCLMLMFFMIHMIDNASYQELTPEKFIKQFGKLILAACLVANGLVLLEKFLLLGAGLVGNFQSLSGGIGGGTEIMETMMEFAEQDTDGFGFWGSLFFIIKLLIPLVISWIINLVVSVICYSRVLELMVKTLFAPIPLCDVFSDSYGHSNSIRYFRGYAATCFQAVVIYAIGFLYSKISVDWITSIQSGGGFEFIIGYLAINLAAITLIVKSGSFSKELCGAA